MAHRVLIQPLVLGIHERQELLPGHFAGPFGTDEAQEFSGMSFPKRQTPFALRRSVETVLQVLF